MERTTPCIGIIGAGTMGTGIAQVAALHGFPVRLLDVDEATAREGIDAVERRIDRLVEKGRVSEDDRNKAVDLLHASASAADFADCDLVIEAIVESLQAKTAVLKDVLPHLKDDATIATNTSALSISMLGESINAPQRVVGMHFFNPAPLMPLVEVIKGKKSEAKHIDRVVLIAEAMGKKIAKANDTPGFIVNRVARPYYLEAWRILEDNLAEVNEIDEAMRSLGGFRMGPFELTDLIGQDVNAATTESVWQQLGKPARLKPSETQAKLVADQHLGRKTGRGAYLHEDEPKPAIAIQRRDYKPAKRLEDAVERFVDGATDQIGAPLEKYIFSRILVAIINEAAWAFADGVADQRNIDLALKLGTNYPKGPFEWAEQIGLDACGELLDALNAEAADHRFAAPEWLKTGVGE